MKANKNFDLSNLKPPAGAKKSRKVIGRGDGSGHGGTSTKGHKGQNARSGGKTHPRFEGGQMPIYRRLPKRGFTNIFKQTYQVVNVSDLERFDGEVTLAKFVDSGLNKSNELVKILGKGNLTKPLTVHASRFSKTAVEKIAKAGGKAVVVE